MQQKNNLKINIAVVGVGYWGPNLVRNFYQLEDVSLAAVCDLDSKKLSLIQKNYPTVQTTQDYKDILKNPNIKAVAIALPTKLHFSFAKAALLAGKHVLLEKPMTATSKEAAELIRIAGQKRKVLMVDHPFVYSGAVRNVKELIEKKDLGNLYYFDSQRANLGLLRPDANVIFDLAVHDISIIDYLFPQKPESVLAIGSYHILKEREEMAHITLKHQGGLISHINVSWLSPLKLRQIIVGGSKKMVFYNDIEPSEKIKVYDKGIDIDPSQITSFNPLYREGDVLIPKLDSTEPLKRVCRHFVDCVKSGKTPVTDGKSALRIIKIMEAISKSIKGGGKLINLN